MRRFLTLLALCTVILGCLTGCATLRNAQAFNVTLVDIAAANATVFESHVVVTLRYTNESNTPLSLSGSRHKLYLNGRAVGTAVNSESVSIPALSTATQDVTLNISNLALVGLLREVQNTRAVNYRIDSTLYVGSRGLGASHEGTVDLRSFSKAAGVAPIAPAAY
jgi:LEA14-like dessication related protein